jgi:hypothetical protein
MWSGNAANVNVRVSIKVVGAVWLAVLCGLICILLIHLAILQLSCIGREPLLRRSVGFIQYVSTNPMILRLDQIHAHRTSVATQQASHLASAHLSIIHVSLRHHTTIHATRQSPHGPCSIRNRIVVCHTTTILTIPTPTPPSAPATALHKRPSALPSAVTRPSPKFHNKSNPSTSGKNHTWAARTPTPLASRTHNTPPSSALDPARSPC